MHAQDPYLWLEEVESPKALQWVTEQNSRMEQRLATTEFYGKTERQIREILLAEDRLLNVRPIGEYVYHLWQDEKNVRGLWRRTKLATYQGLSSDWEILLDLDELARKENENWVWKGSDPSPDPRRFLLQLSRGGKDASVYREFDVQSKTFLQDGFHFPEAKSWLSWEDENHILLSTDYGPGTLTTSGYPRQCRRIARGQKLSDAKLLLEAQPTELGTWVQVHRTEAKTYSLVARIMTGEHSEYSLLGPNDELLKLPRPTDSWVYAFFANHAILLLRSDWKTQDFSFKAGSFVSLDMDSLESPPRMVFASSDDIHPQMACSTRDGLFVGFMENVRSRIAFLKWGDGVWGKVALEGPSQGSLQLNSFDRNGHALFATHQDFLTPDSIWILDSSAKNPAFKKAQSLPAKFLAEGFQCEQLHATSRDGTRVPYFIVHSSKRTLGAKTPTLLYGYGGFGISIEPFYLRDTGKVWLEQIGGAYVLANIRGGGEFGPDWHKSARLKDRQKAFDDFIAVAEDLIRRELTSSPHLGIMGGSNGGLLVGAVMTQRPELFNAVVCQVPLLDMFRYHKLLAGASWMDEYGDPDKAEDWEFISRYSPYHNLREGTRYPEAFFLTSTKDDRVHPGHARKMAARMLEMQHPVLYYENIDGGHAGAANIKEQVKFKALTMSYLKEKLT